MGFEKITEQASFYDNLEKKPLRELLNDINTEDQKVALVVRNAIPQIERLVSAVVPKMREGGRLFYIGAGTSGRLGVLDASEIPPTFGVGPGHVIGIIAGGDTALRKMICNKAGKICKHTRLTHWTLLSALRHPGQLLM